jgi:hypothetical protein
VPKFKVNTQIAKRWQKHSNYSEDTNQPDLLADFHATSCTHAFACVPCARVGHPNTEHWHWIESIQLSMFKLFRNPRVMAFMKLTGASPSMVGLPSAFVSRKFACTVG